MNEAYVILKTKLKESYLWLANFAHNLQAKGFFHLLSSKYILRFVGFGSQLLVIKFLTATELGQIKTIQSYLAVAALFATFGFNTSILKLCSEKIEPDLKAAIFKYNLKSSFLFLGITLLAVFLFSKFKILSPDDNINFWLPIFALSLPATSFIALAGNYLQALKQIKTLAKTQITFSFLGFVSLVGLTYLFGFLGFAISTLFMSYIGIPILLNILKDYLKSSSIPAELKKRSLSYASWSFAANLAGTISAYLDIFILNYILLDREELGYYGIATIFLLALTQITQSLTEIATPYLSEKSNDKIEFYRVLKKYEKILIISSFAITISAFFLIPFFIVLVYGQNYALAGTIFQILAVRFLINSSFTLYGIATLAVGKMKYNFISTALAVPINFIITYVFAMNYGVIGAAIGQTFSAFVILLFRFPISLFALKKHFEEQDKLNKR